MFMSRRIGEPENRGAGESRIFASALESVDELLMEVIYCVSRFARVREGGNPSKSPEMPAFLENWMGPCLRRDDLLKKQMLHQHIEEHYRIFFSDSLTHRLSDS